MVAFVAADTGHRLTSVREGTAPGAVPRRRRTRLACWADREKEELDGAEARDRQGVGRLLLCNVSRRFIKQGVTSMLLFGEASNPFPPLPGEFRGDHVRLQFTFLYNIPIR